jgi:hypothetical protein
MTSFHNLTKLFGLNDETWMRHANKWSVWTRFFILPLFAVAIWSRIYIGWYSLIFVLVLVLWTWINPRFFRKPKTTKHWASKAVFGERVWLKNQALPIPSHHKRAVLVLNIITGTGLPFLVWGLYAFHFWSVLLGLVIVIFGKMWFLDRMVWIYEDMKSMSEEYLSWEY